MPVDDGQRVRDRSLIFWSVTMIVTIAYVAFILRANNEGEGGIMALITPYPAPADRAAARQDGAGRRRHFGASLFFGDSMITPAISVLSAVEGLKVVEPSLESLIVPITAVIIVGVVRALRVGTAAVGRLFGPVEGPRISRTAILWLIYAACCRFKNSW